MQVVTYWSKNEYSTTKTLIETFVEIVMLEKNTDYTLNVPYISGRLVPDVPIRKISLSVRYC